MGRLRLAPLVDDGQRGLRLLLLALQCLQRALEALIPALIWGHLLHLQRYEVSRSCLGNIELNTYLGCRLCL